MSDQRTNRVPPRRWWHIFKIINRRFQLAVLGVFALASVEYLAFALFCARGAFSDAKAWVALHQGGQDIESFATLMPKHFWYFGLGFILLFLINSVLWLAIANRVAGPMLRIERELRAKGWPPGLKFRKGDYVDPSDWGSKGFSLVEVMVAMGVGAVFLLFLAQSLVYNSMSANSTRLDTDFNNLMSQIQLALSNPLNCTPALFDNATSALLQPNPATTTYNLQKIVLNGTAIATVNQPAVGNQVTRLTLSNPTAQGGGNCSGNICLWTLNVGVTKTQAAGQTTFIGNTQTYRHFNLQITTNGGSPDWTITSCSGSAVGADSLWTANGSSIYYNGGNVGIGVVNPVGTLDVEGGTAAAATNGKNIDLIAQNGGAGNQSGGTINLSAGLGSGTGDPGGVTIATVTNSSGNTNGLTIQNYGNGTTGGNTAASIYLASSQGTGAGSSAVLNGNGLGYLDFQGEYDVNWHHGTGAYLYSQATANFTATSTPAFLSFGTTPVNSVFPTERMRIDQNGRVGIGTTAPGYILDVNGHAGSNGFTNFVNYSDRRLKEDIQPLGDGALEKILSLKPSHFKYNARYFDVTGYDRQTKDRVLSGFIAQDLREVFPTMVSERKLEKGTYLDSDLSALQIYLTKAMQELYALVTSKLAALTDRLSALEARVPARSPAVTAESFSERLEKVERENRSLRAETAALKAKSDALEQAVQACDAIPPAIRKKKSD